MASGTGQVAAKQRAAAPAAAEAPYRTIWGAKAAWFPTVVVPFVEAEREKRATTEEREELAGLVRRLGDASRPAPDASEEAKIVGLVLFLQQARIDAGERGYGLSELCSFMTERGERCVVEREGDKKDGAPIVVLERTGEAPVRFQGAGVGAQRVVPGAPLVLIHPNASIAAVLGDVARVEAR